MAGVKKTGVDLETYIIAKCLGLIATLPGSARMRVAKYIAEATGAMTEGPAAPEPFG